MKDGQLFRVKGLFPKVYLQMKDYDGSENSETSITWAPVRVNDDDIEYILKSNITDADIEAWADTHFDKKKTRTFNDVFIRSAMILTAKAALNGEIKHIE